MEDEFMQLNKNHIVEINLRKLFFHILYRWRSILIAALIGALLSCGYQYLSIKKVHDAGELTKEERQYQINLQQYKEELASNQNTIKVYSKLLQEQNEYLNNSIYIQLSPQNVWVASSKYLVKPDQNAENALASNSAIDPADSILPLYSAPLSKVTNEEELKEAFGTDKTEYINELVIVSTSAENNTVTIFVLGESKEAAQSGLALLNEQMEKIANEKTNDITPHKLLRVSDNITRGLDSVSRGLDREMAAKIDLSDKQAALGKTTEENQKTLQKARQRLDELETNGEPVEPGYHLVKMAVIGFVLGAFLMVFLYAVLCIFSGRLNSSHDLTERYKLPVFGELPASNHLHSKNSGLDKLISKWELGKDALDDATVYNNIAALIEEKKDDKEIALVSTLPADKLITTKEALTERITGKNIGIQADIIRNSEAITEASKADAVIIVEEKDRSRLKDMDRMAENLIIAEANVIGAIVL